MRVCDMKYEDKPKLEVCKVSVRSVSPQSYSNCDCDSRIRNKNDINYVTGGQY